MSTTKNTIPNITHFNKKAFENSEFTLPSLSIDPTAKKANVKKELNFFNYSELGCKIESVINAIQVISYAETQLEDKEKTAIVYDLAEILKALIPQNELEFIDKLLVNPTTEQSNMINIKNL